MNIKLGEDSIELDRIELRLGLNAVPSLSLYLKEQHDAEINKQVIEQTETGTLEWQDDSLEFKPFGYQKIPDSRQGVEGVIYALLLEDSLEDWFETRPEAPSRLNYGIYQNRADLGGWTFLHNTLGRKFHVPPNPYQDRIDQVLPISTCLIRPIHQDNQQYLMTVIGYLQHHLPELVGWCSVFGEEEPLRLIFIDEENAVSLDASWENLSEMLPSRYARPLGQRRTTLRKSGLVMHGGMKMALLIELVRRGITEPLSGFLEEGSESDLLYLPGPVKLGRELFLCEAITYGFQDPENSLFMTIELTSGFQTPASTANPTRFEGLFLAWDEGDDDEERVFLTPPEDSTWQMMDSSDSNVLDAEAELMARFVMPTTPNNDYAGLYVRRVEGDRLVFKTQIFQTPMIYGSFQILHEELEAATLSLNTEVLALSTSTLDTGINDMHGVVIDAAKIMNRAKSSIAAEASTITQAKNIQVTEDSLTVATVTDIAKTTTAKKLKVTGVPGYAKPVDPNLNYPINVIKKTVTGEPAPAMLPAQAAALIAAAESGAPFCEECARARAARAAAGTTGDKQGAREDEEKNWIEIKLVDENNQPIAGEKYRITLPDGRVEEGNLDGNGVARFDSIDPGNCKIAFPELGMGTVEST